MKEKKEKKETKPLTSRIDMQLRNTVLEALAAGAFPEGVDSLTDVIERGIPLAINEHHGLSTLEKQVRFMVANTTKDQQRLIRGLLIAMAEPLIDPPPAPGTALQEKLQEVRWEFVQRSLAAYNELTPPLLEAEVMEIYGRYGKKRAE